MQIIRKAVKNVNLTIYPPDGRVSISVPYQMSDGQINDIISARLHWIKAKRKNILQSSFHPKLPVPLKLATSVFGEQYVVEIKKDQCRNSIERCDGNILRIHLHQDLPQSQVADLINQLLRKELRKRIPVLLDQWLPVIGVELHEWRIKKMKTRWGTCNITAKRIWLNLYLAKLPPECLEYVLVHELVHLLERYHNARFWGLMDDFLPSWRDSRKILRSGAVHSIYS